ncbi:zinc transporter ZntB [Thalassobius sp. S69A]|uniref:zinc transporter ZntB n=1 Tax=unclassified Thalassovita TaxID=2619711 RepID=UPI003C7B8BF4
MTEPFVTYAYALDGTEAGQPLAGAALLQALRADAPAWAHLDGKDPAANGWISAQLDYLDPQAIEALLDVDTRPRLTVLGSGMILILRGMNFNAGEDPEDMVSVRMWIDPHRIVTISRKRVWAIERMHEALAAGRGPSDAGSFLVNLIEDITTNIAKFQSGLDQKAEELEHKVISEGTERLRRQVVDMRLQIIAARRYMGPQRDALAEIGRAKLELLDQTTRREIEEEHLKMTRVVEDMDELREQASVLREELSGQLSDRLNRNMFMLSILSAIFLPLGFLTGLFGVNVGGLPGLERSDAFLWLCGAMGGLVFLQVLALWHMRWIGRGG